MLKIFLLALVSLVSASAFSQDAMTTLKLFDSKVYSLKNKGVKDFIVDISSSKLTQQINTMGTFGNVKDLYFRVYWTLNPERLDIEVMGLPEGFKEVKEELKMNVIGLVENILPPPMDKKFSSYKFTSEGNKIVGRDSSGVADIPTITLMFDPQLRLLSIDGQKLIGSVKISPVYEKESFSDGRWVLKKQVTSAEESGQLVTTIKTLVYGPHDGFSVVRSINLSTEQKFLNRPSTKPVSVSETIEFKNYKINNGDAMKHFIKDIPVQ